MEEHKPISLQSKFKHFWMKELQFNIPPKGLVYYNIDKCIILDNNIIKKRSLQFYKDIYKIRNKISILVLEQYLQYSFNYIFDTS